MGQSSSCSHYLRGRNSWHNSWQFILCSIVNNTTHDDILWCTILAQVNVGRCFGWGYIGIRIGIWECDQRRSHQNLFLGTYFTICIQFTIIVYGVGPSVKILTLIQSSKATFTLFCKIYSILISSKSNTFYCTCYLLYMVYELVSKLARDESIWRYLGHVLHIANMDANEPHITLHGVNPA